MAFKSYKKDEKNDILDFISGLPINVDLDVNGNKYLLSHAAPLLKQQPCEYDSPEEYAVRHCTLPDERLGLDRILIHGHTPVLLFDDAFPTKIMKSRDKININCAAGYVFGIGRLACLRLDDMTEYYSD